MVVKPLGPDSWTDSSLRNPTKSKHVWCVITNTHLLCNAEISGTSDIGPPSSLSPRQHHGDPGLEVSASFVHTRVKLIRRALHGSNSARVFARIPEPTYQRTVVVILPQTGGLTIRLINNIGSRCRASPQGSQ